MAERLEGVWVLKRRTPIMSPRSDGISCWIVRERRGHQEIICDAARGTAIEMATGAPGFITVVTFRIALHRSAGLVKHGLAQPYPGGIAHHDDAGLATAFGHRRHSGQGSEGTRFSRLRRQVPPILRVSMQASLSFAPAVR